MNIELTMTDVQIERLRCDVRNLLAGERDNVAARDRVAILQVLDRAAMAIPQPLQASWEGGNR